MTFHIQTQDIALDGVGHKWVPASDTCQAYGFLEFGVTGRSVIMFLSEPGEVDQVIAELVALRADMTADAAPVITDSGRTCDQRNPDGSGEPCHRDGEHARHRDSNGDEWGEAASDEAVKALAASIAGGTPLVISDSTIAQAEYFARPGNTIDDILAADEAAASVTA